MSEPEVMPILKWAGGKRLLLPKLLSVVPARYNKYIEPFFGGGALYFALQPCKAVIGDVNNELINFYSVCRDAPGSLINSVSKLKTGKDDFYRIRSKNPDKLNKIQKASRFLYLNKTCFGGIYRVNQLGNFNVPYAGYVNRSIYDIKHIYNISNSLSHAKLYCKDFRTTLKMHAKPGDLIYLDPPYFPPKGLELFNRYNTSPFSYEDQEELADLAAHLDKMGCYVIASNSCVKEVLALYSGFDISKIVVSRCVSRKFDTHYEFEYLITSKRLNLQRLTA